MENDWSKLYFGRVVERARAKVTCITKSGGHGAGAVHGDPREMQRAT